MLTPRRYGRTMADRERSRYVYVLLIFCFSGDFGGACRARHLIVDGIFFYWLDYVLLEMPSLSLSRWPMKSRVFVVLVCVIEKHLLRRLHSLSVANVFPAYCALIFPGF